MMSTILELTKFRIVRVVAVSTLTGYLMGPHAALDANLLLVVLGTLLLAAGSAALNQVQDAAMDAMMPRTRTRPIPSGRISRLNAAFIGVILALLGSSVLASVEHTPLTALAIGLLALAWYNGVYAFLKRRTPFAVVPGSLVGALPPMIGYVAAGGAWDDPAILLVASFFFVWQVPHFWLLLLLFGEQYADAGQPSLTKTFSPEQLARLTGMWLLAAAGAGMAVAMTPASPLPVRFALALASLAMAWATLRLRRTKVATKESFGRAFVQINVYALAVMVALSLTALL